MGNGKTFWHCVLIEDSGELILNEFDRGQDRQLKQAILREHKPSEWHTIRVVVERIEMSVYLGDELLFKHTADDRDAFDGKIALFAQGGRFEFRDVGGGRASVGVARRAAYGPGRVLRTSEGRRRDALEPNRSIALKTKKR